MVITPREVPFHDGARSALRITAILCLITCIGIPFGIWLLYRVSTARLTIDANGLTARTEFKTVRVAFADVERVGVLRVAIIAGGIAGVLARKKVGGGDAIHLAFRLRGGASKMFMVSMFEGHEQIVSDLARGLNRPIEPLQMGLWTAPKWPGG
jgi:hypothetical protein